MSIKPITDMPTNTRIRVGVAYDFYPRGEHADLFDGFTDEQITAHAVSMAYEDIIGLVNGGKLSGSMFVSVSEVSN